MDFHDESPLRRSKAVDFHDDNPLRRSKGMDFHDDDVPEEKVKTDEKVDLVKFADKFKSDLKVSTTSHFRDTLHTASLSFTFQLLVSSLSFVF